MTDQSLPRLAGLILIGLGVCGFALKQIEWTTAAGAPTTISLLQGNVAQDMKWREDQMLATLDTYANLIKRSEARLIVLPETALPLFLHQIPADYLDALASDRQYRRAMPLDEAMEAVCERSGKCFDPKVVDVLKRL